MSTAHNQSTYLPEDAARRAVAESLEWVRREVLGGGDAASTKRVEDVQQFVVTAPIQGEPGSTGKQQRASFVPLLGHRVNRADVFCVWTAPYYRNPQTAAFCAMLGIENKVDLGR